VSFANPLAANFGTVIQPASSSDPVFGTGKPVTVSWTAPATGNTPTAYRIFLYAVNADASCKVGNLFGGTRRGTAEAFGGTFMH
jgi:hypothetical protein